MGRLPRNAGCPRRLSIGEGSFAAENGVALVAGQLAARDEPSCEGGDFWMIQHFPVRLAPAVSEPDYTRIHSP
jgi:hypothetical protein